MKLTFNILLYHGTDLKNVDSIIHNGFEENTISCATQNVKWAKNYGETLISFKYPFILSFGFKTLQEDIEFFYLFLINFKNKDLASCVAGFKPIKLITNNNGNKILHS